MITLTATPDLDAATVELTVTPTTETVTAIQRRDANGVRTVRTLAGLLPSTSSVVAIDAEASLAGPITYQVMTSTGPGPSATTALDLRSWWIVDPMLPTYALPLALVLDLPSTRASGTAFHDVIGRADPVAAIGPLRLRSGTLDMWCASYEDAMVLQARYATRRVLMLRQGDYPGMDLYHLAESVAVSALDERMRRWLVRVVYREVLPPTGALLTSVGWTFDDVTEQFQSFDAIQFAFADFNALTLGDPL